MLWMIQPRQIEAFRALMLTGRTTRAAEAMHITQPAVSRLVRDLQEALGLVLFEKQGNRLTPTREALALYGEVERSYVGLDRILQSARELRERRAGTLRIAAMPALANGVVPRFTGEFLATRENLDIALFGLVSVTVLDWVVSDQCDLGFAAAPIQHPAVRVERMPSARYVAVLPDGHRLARRRVIRPQDLAAEPFVSIGPTTPSTYRIADVFSAAGVTRRIRVETPLSAIACALVASGAGVSVVDPFTASEAEAHGVIVRPFEPALDFQVAALYPAGRALSPVGREFIDGFARHIERFRRERERPAKSLHRIGQRRQ